MPASRSQFIAPALALLLTGWLARAGPESTLYGPRGVAPLAVRQGSIGSCYFHASVAAIAQTNPRSIEQMIRPNQDGTYSVQFPDGKKENAYPQDIDFARRSGYEQSEGLWVGVLFRAYAQRVLRSVLLEAAEKSARFPPLKKYAADFIASNDSVLLAYDRAIRAVVDQTGYVGRPGLEKRLRDEMKPVSVPETIKESLIGLLNSAGVLDAVAQTVRENGELFGAYRAMGQGGLPERVLATLSGANPRGFWTSKDQQRAGLALLENAARQPLVATSALHYSELFATGQLAEDDKTWYIANHAFTVLAYDSLHRTVTLRNPWAEYPRPDGVFTIPLAKFFVAFPYLSSVSGQ